MNKFIMNKFILNKFIMNNGISETANEIKIEKEKKVCSSRISGNKCCLPHCGKSKRSDSKLKIFRFPYLDNLLLKAWMEKCNLGKDYMEKAQKLYICEKHFPSDCIGKKYLRRSAVPSLNLTAGDDQPPPVVQQENSYKSQNDTLFPVITPSYKPKPTVCNNCHKISKNVELYRKKYFNTFNKLKALRQEKQSLNRKIKRLKNRVRNLKPIVDRIDNLDINPNEKTLCKMLIKQNRGTNARWDEHETSLAQSIFYKSPSTYKFLRNNLNLNLPSCSSLSRWKDTRTGDIKPDDNLQMKNAPIEDAEFPSCPINAESLELKNTQNIAKCEDVDI